MEPEERAARQVKAVSDKIWEYFLMEPDKATEYELQEPSGENFMPSKARQIGIIKKIEKNWRGAISNVRQIESRIIFNVHREEFNRGRKQFANPNTAFQSYKLSKVTPVILPAGTDWEHIVIRFLNGHDVRITLRNDSKFKLDTTYNEMGFRDNRQQRPNKQWKLLVGLSTNNGSISWDSVQSLSTQEILKFKKRKQLLSEALQAKFQIEDDPFYNYRKEKAYRIKINLIPITGGNSHQSEESDFENYYEEQTPQIVE